MPYVNVQITQGATRAQKETLVSEISEALVRVLGKRREHINIVIHEVAPENWGVAGMLADTYLTRSPG